MLFLGAMLFKKPNAPSFQIGSGWNFGGLSFRYTLSQWFTRARQASEQPVDAAAYAWPLPPVDAYEWNRYTKRMRADRRKTILYVDLSLLVCWVNEVIINWDLRTMMLFQKPTPGCWRPGLVWRAGALFASRSYATERLQVLWVLLPSHFYCTVRTSEYRSHTQSRGGRWTERPKRWPPAYQRKQKFDLSRDNFGARRPAATRA